MPCALPPTDAGWSLFRAGIPASSPWPPRCSKPSRPASRLGAAGAPLGADFCAISLSDNLKSWATIERRLEAAARGDFVIALYNPASRARPDQLPRALALLRQWKAGATVVLFVHAAGTPAARLHVTDLDAAGGIAADMRTLIVIGSDRTRLIPRDGVAPWVYTPRSEAAPT
jgi:precorrin-3B C17-methyltransferase